MKSFRTFSILAVSFFVIHTRLFAQETGPSISAPHSVSFSRQQLFEGEGFGKPVVQQYEFIDIGDDSYLFSRREGSWIQGNDSTGTKLRFSNELVKVKHDTAMLADVFLDIHVNGRNAPVFCYQSFNNNVWAFGIQQKDSATVEVYAQAVNTISMCLSGEPARIFTYKNFVKFDPLKNNNQLADLPHIKKSENDKQLLLLYAETDRSGRKEKIIFSVFNTSFDNSWSGSFLPLNNCGCFGMDDFKSPAYRIGTSCKTVCAVQNFSVSNDGTVLIEAIDGDDKNHDAYVTGATDDNFYHIITWSADDKQRVDHAITMHPRVIDCRAIVLHSGKVIVTGYYTNEKQSKGENIGYCDMDEQIDGTFFMSFEKHSKKADVSLAIPNSTNLLEAEKNKNGKIIQNADHLENYQLGYIAIDADDNVFLTSQYIYFSEGHLATYSMGGGQTFTTSTGETHYNDILVYKFSADGKLSWASRIPNKQTPEMADLESFGYYFYQHNGSAYFFYAESDKNSTSLPQSDENEYHGAKSGRLCCMEADASGRITKYTLGVYKLKGKEPSPMASDEIYPLNKDTFFFVGGASVQRRMIYRVSF